MSTNVPQAGMRDKAQEFGRFLSGMVMPNIPAFIGWGFITALFIPTGWMPNAQLSAVVGPIIVNLLPILIGYTGGKAVAGQRGAVVGAFATMGMICGGSIPMFMGAMIAGPLAGYLMKKVDQALEGKSPAGFEMLINNFSAGILAMILCLINLVSIGPIISAASNGLGNLVGSIVKAGFIPLASILIEPAKILFLNNAINHGVLSPLGIQQAATAGKSIYFMLESNPGPGLGLLLAYAVASKGAVKSSAPGAIIIHFLGGIHEIYFPYVLMNPKMIIAMLAGGMSGVFTFSILGAGLVAPPSPGSIFAYILMTPKGSFIPVMTGVLVAAAVSFVVGAMLLKNSKEYSEDELSTAQVDVKNLKG